LSLYRVKVSITPIQIEASKKVFFFEKKNQKIILFLRYRDSYLGGKVPYIKQKFGKLEFNHDQYNGIQNRRDKNRRSKLEFPVKQGNFGRESKCRSKI